MTKLFGQFAAILFLTILLAVGCGGGDDDDNDDGADDDGADDTQSADDTEPVEYPETCSERGFELNFDLSSDPMIVPYPNDLFTVEDAASQTGRRVQLDEHTASPMGLMAKISLLSFVIDAVNTLNGFSTAADLYIPIGAEPDPDYLPGPSNPGIGDSVFLMADDPDSPFDGEFVPLTPEWRPFSLHLRPFVPLHENTHYVLVATRKLYAKSRSCYRASESMREIWETYKHGTGGTGERYHESIARLEELGLDAGDILSISDFTTLVITRDLDDVRKTLDELVVSNPPAFKNWSFMTEADGVPADWNIDSLAWAELPTPRFQNADGYWIRDAEGNLVVQSWEDVLVHFALPKADSPGGQPFPLALWGHGVGDHKESLQALAQFGFCSEGGFALAGMDAVCHGDRAPIPHDPVSTMLCYFDFFNPLRFRDNLRETIANYMWFARALKSAGGSLDLIPHATSGDGTPDFDVSSLSYTSISMGSIHAGVFMALEENIDAWAVSSAGAKLTGIALEGPYLGEMVDIAQILDQMVPGLHAEDGVWLLGGLAQHILDAGDPFNYLPHAIKDPLPGLESHVPQVLQQSAADDEMLGGLSGGYYARAGGWPELDPFVWEVGIVGHAACPHQGSGFYQFDTSEHFNLWLDTPMGDAYRAQMLHYLSTHHETGTGEIIDPLAK